MGWQHELSRKIYLYAQKMNNDSISINARSKRTGPLTTALRNYMKSRMKFLWRRIFRKVFNSMFNSFSVL